MKIIRVFTTRIEIEPYYAGENRKLEAICSSKYNPTTHQRDFKAFRIEDNRLIIPRGVSLELLSQSFDAIPTFEAADPYADMPKRYKVLAKPKNDTQIQAISFLLGLKDFQKSRRYSQLALTLDTGLGKTYCAVYAILAFGVRTIIILHRDSIREQWIKTFFDKTDMDLSRVCDITGSQHMQELLKKKERNKYDIYLVLHSTLSAFTREYGSDELGYWFHQMQFGLKVTDEAHLCFKQTVETDFCTNIAKNIYLTATMTRSDPKEAPIFNTVFANTLRFGEDIGTVKNVVYKYVYYNSNPTYMQQAGIRTGYGVSVIRWADYAFRKDPNRTIYGVFFEILKEALTHEGKVLVVVPKIEYCNELAQMIKELYPDMLVGTVHSRNTKDLNERVKRMAQIIVTTIASSGTGTDIKFIRSLIIMEPYSSNVTAKQLTGRLREYEPGEESYAYELVDTGFDAITAMLKRRSATLKQKCKKVSVYKKET
jgi:superfamily II DNA or RNA helicase